jgi:prevent-host-death family protein
MEHGHEGAAMKQVNIHQAKTGLSKLVERAEAGEEIVIARASKPVARLPPIHRDPFDRLLIAQSLAEPLTLLTNDAILGQYASSVRMV